jgi:predicted Zn-ribbon and HTH transcriptional regulator
MEPFNKEQPSQCPQCGGDATSTYHRSTEGFIPCTGIAGVPKGKAHMHRKCLQCKYEWGEEPGV